MCARGQCAQRVQKLKNRVVDILLACIFSKWKLSEFYDAEKILVLSFLLFQLFRLKVEKFHKNLQCIFKVKLKYINIWYYKL